ncbi:hypothetical protein KKI23_03895 [Patescibacteria group bacterium]|nr:hypothetical protein [Patescibacteria group bacterium]
MTVSDLWWEFKDRPSIWVPLLTAVWSIVLMAGFMGTIVNQTYLSDGGQSNFLTPLFLTLGVFLLILFVFGILGMMAGDALTVGAVGGLAVCGGILVGVLCPIVSVYGLRLIAPGILQLPAIQAFINFQFSTEPYFLFVNVGYTGLAFALVAAPLLVYSLLALVYHLIKAKSQSRSFQPVLA